MTKQRGAAITITITIPFRAFIMARSRADNNAQVEPAVVRSRVG